MLKLFPSTYEKSLIIPKDKGLCYDYVNTLKNKVVPMAEERLPPEERRERLRQEELKHPSSSIHGGGLPDLVGGLNWKATGMIVIVILIALLIIALL